MQWFGFSAERRYFNFLNVVLRFILLGSAFELGFPQV